MAQFLPTLLIVDDNVTNLKVLTGYLEGYNFEVMTARNGEDCLKKASLGNPHLILLDILMPGMDGFETCRRLKNNQNTRNIPVIFMTALADLDSKVTGFEVGAVDYITKPFQPQEVLARVTVQLRLQELARSLQDYAAALEKEVEERKQIEVELKKYQEHLEELVEEQVHELRRANRKLQQEIVDREKAEEQIRIALREKEVLLKEIHHRVKNNMQIISSLLDLQYDYIDDQKTREVFEESQFRIKSMALVHERLYQSQDLARIDFAEYAESLTGSIFRAYGAKVNDIKLRLNVAPIFLTVQTAIPCGLIINELVSNALKYAFPDNRPGELDIELDHNEQQLSLCVKDNGVGLPLDIDMRNTPSLGLTLVKTLVKQLGGEFKWEVQRGSRFDITFNDPNIA